MYSFVDKYAPKELGDIVSQKLAVSKFIEFLNNFSRKKKKAVILHGPTGVGKTTSVYTLANELDYELIEMNSDEIRDKETLDYKLTNAINSGSIFGKKKMILIDELESIKSSGLTKIMSLIRKSRIPVVLIVLDVWDPKLKYLRLNCELIKYNKIRSTEISKRLKQISDEEGIEYETDVIDKIAKNANGDLRAAIIDLETVSLDMKKITLKDTFLEERNIERSVFEALQKIFKSEFSKDVLDTFNSANIDINTGILWLSENICNEYKDPNVMADAYNYISRSDVFMGRIRRRQYWRFYVYANILSTAGINVSKDSPNPRFVKYDFPSKLLKLSKSKKVRTTKKSIATKISPKLHTSSNVFVKEYLPMFKIMLKKNPKLKKKFVEYADLTSGEVEFLAE